MKFPKPWKIERVNHDSYVVLDADDQKLFYIVGDEGDDDEARPSALFHINNGADDADILDEIEKMLP